MIYIIVLFVAVFEDFGEFRTLSRSFQGRK